MSQETREGGAFVAQKFGVCVMVSRDAMAASKVDELARRKKQARGDLAVKVFEAIPNDYATMLSVRETMEPNNEVRAVDVRITADVTPLPEALETAYRLCQENAALRSQLAAAESRLAAAERLLRSVDQVYVGDVKLHRTSVGKIHLSRLVPARETLEHQSTDTKNLIDAYLAAVAANWLPTERKDG